MSRRTLTMQEQLSRAAFDLGMQVLIPVPAPEPVLVGWDHQVKQTMSSRKVSTAVLPVAYNSRCPHCASPSSATRWYGRCVCPDCGGEW